MPELDSDRRVRLLNRLNLLIAFGFVEDLELQADRLFARLNRQIEEETRRDLEPVPLRLIAN